MNFGKKTKKTIAFTLSSSILLSACNSGHPIDIVDMDEITSSKAVPISISLDDETKENLTKISPLVQEIITNPKIAKELSRDPTAFCEARGYNFNLNLDDPIYKILLALGDDEINESLMNADIDNFINICIKKGFINDEQKIKIGLTLTNDNDTEILKALSGLTLDNTQIGTKSVALWVVVSVVVVVAIVITYVFGAEDMDDTELKTGPELVMNDVSALDLWNLKTKKSDFQLVSVYKDKLVGNIIHSLKDKKPEVFEKFSETQVSEFIKKNMIV